MDLSKLEWKYVSHVTYGNCYIRSEVSEVDGTKIYKHITTRRNKAGMPVGTSKITYSETMQSEDLHEEFVIKLMEKNYNI